ncbi:MAG: hypothetical protein P1U68_10180 [Verrucomicrobiales bacterium]|nr:hypothetical protein [Verrucomicrobiales bacterium]
MKPLLSLSILILSAGAALSQNSQSHLLIEDTTSPDGRYAIGWGIPYVNAKLASANDLDLEAAENYLIDLTTGDQIATLGTHYFATEEYTKNHSGISTAWRSDSRALFFVEASKWGFERAGVIYLTSPDKGYDQCSDAIPLGQSLRSIVRAEMKKDHPQLSDRLNDFEISAYPLTPVWKDNLSLNVTAEVPKSADEMFYEKAISVALPGPDLLTLQPLNGDRANAFSDLITANSVGPVRIGMTIGEARAAIPSATFERTSDGEGIAYVAVIENGETLFELNTDTYDPAAPIDDAETIGFIQVWSPRYKTTDHISTGTSVEEAETTFGPIKEIMLSEIESREYAEFKNQPSGLYFRLTHKSGTAGNYLNNNLTTRYNSGATIHTIEVTGPHIMKDGSIGGIKLDAGSEEILRLARENEFGVLEKGDDEIWEAFGQAVQTWSFPQAGISFDMISDEIGGPKSVFSITATAPCELTTGMGIQTGDSKTEVIDAYRAYESTNESADGYFGDGDVHLVGSIYGGMIFTFENGQLSEIFLGAAAE